MSLLKIVVGVLSQICLGVGMDLFDLVDDRSGVFSAMGWNVDADVDLNINRSNRSWGVVARPMILAESERSIAAK